MNATVGTLQPVVDVASLALALARSDDAVTAAYCLLEDVAAAHALAEAYLVMRPRGIAPQLFTHDRRARAPESVATMLARPVGLYTQPDVIDAATRTTIGAMCTMALTAQLSRRRAVTDEASGLASASAIDAALERAAACSARYGWPFTAVLLTVTGKGTAEASWRHLCDALRTAARSGDEVGVAGYGRALAVLGNAGPEVVRPFVARVRAALTDSGAEGIDLLAATAGAPDETVDPVELRRLAAERLDEMDDAAPDRLPPVDAGLLAELEISVRELPGVVCVGTSDLLGGGGTTEGRVDAGISVITAGASDRLRAEVERRTRELLGEVSVHVLVAEVPAAEVPAVGAPAVGGAGNGTNGSGEPSAHPPEPPVSPVPPARGITPPRLTATGSTTPSGESTPGPTARVALVSAAFDGERGTSEVRLARGAASGTGRAPAGPLAGGAQATLNALGALGIDLPFYLVSVERVRGVPGDPVVVALAPRTAGTPEAPGAERVGVATGSTDVDAASRATLGALNRYIVGPGAEA